MALNRSGFSMVEAVMVSSAIGIVAMIASSLFLQAGRVNRQISARAQIQRDARTCLLTIERELSQARGRTIVIDRFDGSQPPYSRLSFSLFDGRSVSVYQKGDKLYRRVVAPSGTSTVLIATGLRQLVFSYPMSDNTALVSIGLSFERDTYDREKKSLQLSLARVRVQNADSY